MDDSPVSNFQISKRCETTRHFDNQSSLMSDDGQLPV